MTVALSSSAALLSAMASGAAMAGSDAAASDVGAVAEEAIGSCSPASSPSCVEGSNASSYSCAPMRSAEELVRLDARWHAVEQRSAKSWLAEHLFGGERSLFERRCSVERMRIYAPPNRHSLDEIFGEGATAFIERFGAKLYVELCERDIATMRYAICPHFEELDRLYGFPDHIHEALEELGTYDYNEYVAIPWHALKTREEVGQYAAIARGHSYGTIGVILNLVPLISCLKDFRRAIDDARHIVNVFHDYRFKAFEESSPISLDLLKTHACLGNGRLEALVERMGLAALDSALEVYEDKKRSIMRQLLASFPPDRTDLLEDASRYLDEFKGYGPLFFSTVLPTVAGIAESPEELKRVCESGLQVADAIHGERCDKLPRAYEAMVKEFRRDPTHAHWEEIVSAWRDFYDVVLSFPVDPDADRAEVLHVIDERPKVFEALDERWRGDFDVALAAVGRMAENIAAVHPDLRMDPNFIRRAYEANWMIEPHVDTPPWIRRRYESMARLWRRLDIRSPHRFNAETIEEIVRNRLRIDAADPRPPVGVLYPRKDKRDAYAENQIWKWMKEGYRILLFEIDRAEDLHFALSELRRMPGGGKKRLKTAIAAGHSIPTMTAFGDGDPRYAGNGGDGSFYAFELHTPFARALAELDYFLADGSDVIVEGCGAGAGEGRIVNVLNRLATFYRRSRLHGATRTAPTPAYRFDAHRKVHGPSAQASALASVDYDYGFDCEIPTYVIEPRE